MGGPNVPPGREREAEVTHVGRAVGGDHHVVGMPGGDLGEVAMHPKDAVRVPAEQPAIVHRDDEQAPVGQPSQARDRTLERGDGRRRAVRPQQEYAVGVDVRNVESLADPPPRGFAEREI
jgi:hypothetical protein